VRREQHGALARQLVDQAPDLDALQRVDRGHFIYARTAGWDHH
jgi:hypothetical protein